MMKRYVVLQEESLLIGELVRLQQVAQSAPPPAAVAAPVGMPVAMTVGAGPVAAPPPIAYAPPPPMPVAMPVPSAGAAPIDPDDVVVDDKTVEADGVDLQLLARNAAMKAEREAIDAGAGQVPLEPAQGGRLPQGQLQDAPQQDEGVRDLRAGWRVVARRSNPESIPSGTTPAPVGGSTRARGAAPTPTVCWSRFHG